MSVSTVTPANVITTARTAAGAAASSTAKPYDSGNITVWQLPGHPTTKLVDGTQRFSTQQGQVFADFATGNVQAGADYALQQGTPGISE